MIGVRKSKSVLAVLALAAPLCIAAAAPALAEAGPTQIKVALLTQPGIWDAGFFGAIALISWMRVFHALRNFSYAGVPTTATSITGGGVVAGLGTKFTRFHNASSRIATEA